MKKAICICMLGITLALTGCSNMTESVNNPDTTVSSGDISVGSRLRVHNTDEETAQTNMNDWLTAGQTYTVISYQFKNTDSPYARGVSAFGVREVLSSVFVNFYPKQAKHYLA